VGPVSQQILADYLGLRQLIATWLAKARSCRCPYLRDIALGHGASAPHGNVRRRQEHPPRVRCRRGYTTIDTDYGGWELPGALWDEPRMSALLAEHTTIAVSGTAQNQGRFYDRFEHVVYENVVVRVVGDVAAVGGDRRGAGTAVADHRAAVLVQGQVPEGHRT
jgi:hypothetical protein